MPATRTFETAWGRMAVAATARGVGRVVLRAGCGSTRSLVAVLAHTKADRDDPPLPRRARKTHENTRGGERAGRHARRAERQIREYLSGRRRRFTVPLNLDGLPPWQRRVLAAARRIPYGRTATYGRVAARAGEPNAARAVGQAMARNPVPILVPCHRVTATGGLGGFGGGLGLKRRLLALESPSRKRKTRT